MAHSGNVLMSTVFRVTRASRAGPVRVTRAAIGIIALVVVAGCNSAERENDTMKDAFDALMKRPNLTVVEAGYQMMFESIRERLTAEVGIAEWVPAAEPIHGTSCGGKISKLDGGAMRLYNAGVSPGNLPDTKWDQAVAIVAEVAKQHGFGAPEVFINGPSDHEVLFHDTYYGQILFGTGYNTILGGGTGCHLTEEAHRRGTYLPPHQY